MTTILLAFAAAAAAQGAPPAVASSSAPSVWVDVVWPKEGAAFPHLQRSFTLGNVAPGSSLTVNGVPVEVRPSGAFLAMVDFSTGAFALRYEARLGESSSSAVRNVSVEAPYGMSPGDLGAARALEPSVDLELRAGDLLTVRALGPPGRQGSFQVKGLTGRLPMAERGSGVYEGHYVLQPGDRGKRMSVRLELKAQGAKALKAEAPGKVTALDPSSYRVVRTSAPLTVVKSPPGGYTFFLPPGVPLAVVGRVGSLLRVELSGEEDGLVDSDRVTWLPEGTLPPASMVGRFISVVPGAASEKVHFAVDRRLPFEVRHSVDPLRLEVRFYGGMHRVDRIHYATGSAVVSEVRWEQESSRTAVFTVDTRLAWGWGYDAYYQDGRFTLEIRKPPLLPAGKPVLAGRRVAVDAGHGPEASAVGPLGNAERDLVLAISERLRDLLMADGASVYMVRASSEGPPLADRPALAWRERADVYVSVHANALPVTAAPYEAPRGFMTFYYQPMSRPLAEAVHESYRRSFPALADEGLRWGDLHVCRATQMPSILTESAYVILPEQEELLRDPAQQERFARTIRDGLRAYYEAYRKLQLASPAEKRAAAVP